MSGRADTSLDILARFCVPHSKAGWEGRTGREGTRRFILQHHEEHPGQTGGSPGLLGVLPTPLTLCPVHPCCHLPWLTDREEETSLCDPTSLENIPECPWCRNLPPVPVQVSSFPSASCMLPHPAQQTLGSWDSGQGLSFPLKATLFQAPAQAHQPCACWQLCLLQPACQGGPLFHWGWALQSRDPGSKIRNFPAPPAFLLPWAGSGYIKAARLLC